MNNHTYINDDDGNVINPATVGQQQLLVDEALKSTVINSSVFGTERIT